VEEILVAIIQFLFEAVAQSIWSFPFGFYPPDDSSAGAGRGWLIVAVFVGGLAAGAASIALVPHSYLHHAWLRVASLVVSPLLAGAIAWCLAEMRISYRPEVVPSRHFWYAFTFTMGLSLYRFAYGPHAGA
jgi:hypothetical protein